MGMRRSVCFGEQRDGDGRANFIFGGMSGPRVSVVLPVWNAAGTIARAVESVRAQTWTDWALIVVDDGSTDGTREVLKRLAREEKRMRVLEREHTGVAATANAAMTEARGEFIARMDADDVSHPERLAEQVAFLESEKKANAAGGRVDVVSCLVEFGGDRAANAGYALHVDWVNALSTPEEIVLNRFVEQPVVNPSVMFRRELVARLGGFRDGDFPEDYELWLRWLDAGVRIGKVPRVLLRWNDSPERATRTDARYAPEKFFRVKAEWIAREVKRMAKREGVSRQDGAADETLTRSATRRIFVWGAGRHTRKRAAAIEAFGVKIAGYVDVDAKKIGRGIGGTGLPVIGVDSLPRVNGEERAEIFVLSYVSTRGARDYNRARLVERGYVEGRDFLMCG